MSYGQIQHSPQQKNVSVRLRVYQHKNSQVKAAKHSKHYACQRKDNRPEKSKETNMVQK